MIKVYLAGPINGCTDDECKGWRAEARRLLEPMHAVIDPMDFDCRGLEGDMAADIIKHDLNRLDEADLVLVNAERPSWGTAMELVYARQGGKPAVAFVGMPRGFVSPWLQGHTSKVCGTLFQACFEIVNFYRAEDATSDYGGKRMTGLESNPETREMTFAVVWSDEVAKKSLPDMNNRLGELMEYRGAAWRLHSIGYSPEGCESRKEWMVHFGFEEVPGGVDSLEPDSLVKFARENYLTQVDLGHKWARYRVGGALGSE